MTQIWRFLGPWAIPKTKVNAEKHTSILTRIQHFTSTKTLPYLLFTSKIKPLIYWYILEHSECRGPSDDFSCGEHSFPSQGKEQFLSPASPILWIQTHTIHREEPNSTGYFDHLKLQSHLWHDIPWLRVLEAKTMWKFAVIMLDEVDSRWNMMIPNPSPLWQLL